MKVVLDTNVLVSGIFWGGAPLRILEFWSAGKVTAIASDSILEEYLKTIQLISKKIHRPDLYKEWSRVLPSKISIVAVRKSFRLCRDPKDDQFIDCAIAGQARYIISGDKDLLVLNRVMRVRMVNPRQFIQEMQ